MFASKDELAHVEVLEWFLNSGETHRFLEVPACHLFVIKKSLNNILSRRLLNLWPRFSIAASAAPRILHLKQWFVSITRHVPYF